MTPGPERTSGTRPSAAPADAAPTTGSTFVPGRDVDVDADRPLTVLAWLAPVLFSAYHLYYAQSQVFVKARHTVLSILLAYVTVVVLEARADRTDDGRGWLEAGYRGLLVAASVGPLAYVFFSYYDLLSRLLDYTLLEYVLAAVFLAVTIREVYRTYGRSLTYLVVASVLYAFLGPVLPGPLYHQGLSVQRLLETNVLAFSGGLGFIPQVGATWVVVFLVYGGLLQAYGALDLFNAIGATVANRVSSGTAQFAVLASLLLGTVVGVSAANTATTGSFTIPLMKRYGLRADSAGAIESIASSGGQVLPPVMGLAAFVMPSIVGVRYARIIQLAVLPALLYYLAIAVAAHVASTNQGLRRFEQADAPAVEPTRSIPIGVSIGVLLFYLVVRQFGPMAASFNAIVALVAVDGLYRLVPVGHGGDLRGAAGRFLRGMRLGGTTAAHLLPAIVGVGVIVQMVQSGRIIQTLTFSMLDLGGDQLLPLLVLAMVLTILIGLGAPTVVAYVIVAVVVGPIVTQFGVAQVHAHLFVFYFAVLSAITPPFAIACLVACGISGASFIATCRESVKLAAPIYLIPFAFVIHEELLVWDVTTLSTFPLVALALLGVIVGVNGYAPANDRLPARAVLVAGAGAVVFVDGTLVNLLGGLGIVLALGYSWATRSGGDGRPR